MARWLPRVRNGSLIHRRLVAGGQPSCRVSKGTLIATCADGELGFEFRSEPSDLPLQIDTALDPRDTAVEIVEPDAHRGDVTFDGGQSHDRFIELAVGVDFRWKVGFEDRL